DGFLQRAFEMGADDLLAMPTPPEEIEFSLMKVMARRRGTLAGGTTNPMICIIGPKGGTGKTLAASNLAVALAEKARRAVIVDTPPGFTPEVIASIDLASNLLVVGMLDALSLKDTKLGLETLALMGCDPERIRLVLNRADTSVGIKRSEAEAILGRKPDVFVPSDREIPRATTAGQPIVVAAGRSEAARAFHALA